MASVALDHVVRKDHDTTILDDVSFHAADGEFLGLIGPSGAGKTSIIRAIAGFDELSSGSVRFDDDDLTTTPTRERDIGLVTQGNALFPTERVRGNLLFPLWARGVARAEARKRVEVESRANDLVSILDRWPATLSAGEQQLTQIARSLIRRPRVFLMDEPLTNLDPPTRQRLRHELVEMQKGYGVTTIYVANRADEIMTMPDRVVAIERGRVVQTGTPDEIYRNPASIAIARLTGELGTIEGTLVHDGNGYVVVAPEFALRLVQPVSQHHIGAAVTVGVRSQDVRITPSGPVSFMAGAVGYEGSRRVRELHSSAGTIRTIDADVDEHERVSVWLERPQLFDGDGRRIIEK
jgi:multiple sugar transport system ATP-binding protein